MEQGICYQEKKNCALQIKRHQSTNQVCLVFFTFLFFSPSFFSPSIQEKELTLALRALSNFKTSEIEKSVQSMSNDEVDMLMKFIYRGFEKPSDKSCGVLLTWHEKVFLPSFKSFWTTLLMDSCPLPQPGAISNRQPQLELLPLRQSPPRHSPTRTISPLQFPPALNVTLTLFVMELSRRGQSEGEFSWFQIIQAGIVPGGLSKGIV